MISPKSGDKILEIGCGWGGFAEFVGKNYDINMDCITISQKQFDYASKRIFKNGLNEKIKIKLKDLLDALIPVAFTIGTIMVLHYLLN